jgi:transposase
MSSTITETQTIVIGGVDTHRDFHVAVVINIVGEILGSARFDTNPNGYDALLKWMASFGPLVKIGVEGTGAYGAGLARHLLANHVEVIEVNRPNRQTRRRKGKSDVTDAEAAARAVLSGEATLIPKDTTGKTEAIRALRVVRRSCVHNRTQAANQIRNLILTAPAELRCQLDTNKMVTLCNRISELEPTEIVDALGGTIVALQLLTTRWRTLGTELRTLDKTLGELISRTAPARLLAMTGVGTDVCGALLVAAGENPERVHNEAGFAALCGVSPVETSSGKRQGTHRLNQGGNRQANNALWRIAFIRMSHHQPTRDYFERRTKQGKTRKAIIRCLMRYIAREIFNTLKPQLHLT